ncbi:MAG: hypothetical protein M0P13_12340 [Fibrobacteraceae bacterium]|nr:hypothetical protein [Fibrobacteraceae bacterium]
MKLLKPLLLIILLINGNSLAGTYSRNSFTFFKDYAWAYNPPSWETVKTYETNGYRSSSSCKTLYIDCYDSCWVWQDYGIDNADRKDSIWISKYWTQYYHLNGCPSGEAVCSLENTWPESIPIYWNEYEEIGSLMPNLDAYLKENQADSLYFLIYERSFRLCKYVQTNSCGAFITCNSSFSSKAFTGNKDSLSFSIPHYTHTIAEICKYEADTIPTSFLPPDKKRGKNTKYPLYGIYSINGKILKGKTNGICVSKEKVKIYH